MTSIRKRNWSLANGDRRSAWVVDVIDVTGERIRKQFDTKQQAEEFRLETESKKRIGNYRADSKNLTVAECSEVYITYCQGRLERRERMTRHNFLTYQGHIRNYICATEASLKEKLPARQQPFTQGLGAINLKLLSAGMVADFRDRLRAAGVSVPTTRKILGTLKQILRFAITRDLVTHNVAKEISVIGRRDERSKKIVPPSKEGMRQLLTAADPDFRVVLLFAALTGVRAGELHALRWKHIDFKKAEVTIETRVDAYGEEDTTKTVAGLRTVPMGSNLLQSLAARKARTVYYLDDDLVFPGPSGRYRDHNNMVRDKFARLFTRLDTLHQRDPGKHPKGPDYFNWHALRHFAISCWIEAGLAPKTVQTFAGHSSLSVTMDRYGHMFKSDDHRAAMDAIALNVEMGPPKVPETLQIRAQLAKDFIP